MNKLLYLSLLVLAASGSLAQTVAERAKHYNIKKNVAIEGYDPSAISIIGHKKANHRSPKHTRGLPISLPMVQIAKNLKATLKNMSLPMVAGALTRWVKQVKK